MRLKTMGMRFLLAIVVGAITPAAPAASVDLAPAWPFCGTNLYPARSPITGSEGTVDAACDLATGAATVSGVDPAPASIRTMEPGRATAYFYSGEVIPQGVHHRRYTLRVRVDEAWVRSLTPLGPRIDVGLALSESDCRAACRNPSAGAIIAGDVLGPASIKDGDVRVVLDYTAESGAVLDPGRVSIMVWVSGSTPIAGAGPSSFFARATRMGLSAETIA